jgi:transposase
MNKPNKFSPEIRERAVRMVQAHRGEYPSPWAAVESIALKIGCVPQTLLDWVKRTEIDAGHVQARARLRRSESRNWSERTKNCAVQTISGPRPALFSPKRSSTAN